MSHGSIEELLERELDRVVVRPALRSPEERLAAGRRALRARRVRVTVTAMAAVIVLGAGYAVATTGGPGGRAVPPIAVDPTPPEPTAPDAEPTAPSQPPPWDAGEPVRYWDGELEIRDGVTVHQHIVNPFGYSAPRTSDALDITWRGSRQWVIAETDERGRPLGVSTAAPSNGWADLEAYVADQADLATGGADGWPATMRLAADGQVVAVPGAAVLHRTDDPRLGPTFAPDGATTGAALVRPPGEEQAYFVVWRVVEGELDVITTPPADVVGATWKQLLSHARGRYADGEGLR